MKRASTISLPVEIGLRFIGMWPESAYSNLYWSMYMTLIVVAQYYQYSYVVARFDVNNLIILTDCLGLALANTLVLLKLVCLFWNRRIFYNILAAMDRDWRECIINDSSIMMTVADQSRRCSLVLIGIHVLAGFFLSIGLYIIRMMNSNVSRDLPVKMQFPFAALESPIFEFILAGQMFYIMSTASMAGMVNALLASLVIHMGGQVDILRRVVMELHCSNDDGLGTSVTLFSDLIHRHRKIISLSNDIENLFSSIALLQLLWNTLIICCSGFMIVLALSSKKGAMVLTKSTFLYIAKTLEVFVFCYAGEFLSFKSKSISDAVYESLWYNLMPSDCRALLLIMMRSQKRLTITAGKIFDLTLDGFMSVMRVSASYMSVLHAMY
ncbi:odorant receptor 82a [Solenopsis invicta]|uniref:odorant receptor 82a n=1 Tax=Solenopsis invicta TaxID=13686 RepID=UPI00193E6BF6|nr:odorant receptor 82a [Solenopsis invicta]